MGIGWKTPASSPSSSLSPLVPTSRRNATPRWPGRSPSPASSWIPSRPARSTAAISRGRRSRLLALKAVQIAPVPLGGAPLPLERRRSGAAQLLRVLEAGPERFRGFFVKALRQAGGPALFREPAHYDVMFVGTQADADGVARMEHLGRLGALAVHLHLAARYGGGGRRARLIKTGGPEPFF